MFSSFSVYYQLYKMLDNHGEPCNASEHYSPDDCADEAKFKVGTCVFDTYHLNL